MVKKQNNAYLFQCISCFEVLLRVLVLLLSVSNMVLVLLLSVSNISCVSSGSSHRRCTVKRCSSNIRKFQVFSCEICDFFRTPILKNFASDCFCCSELKNCSNTSKRNLISLLFKSDFSVEIEIIQ